MCFDQNAIVVAHTIIYSFSYFSELCLVQPDPAMYSFINQGVLTVNGIDDVEEMGLTDVSFLHCEIQNILHPISNAPILEQITKAPKNIC